MAEPSIGRLRGMAELADGRGIFCILACDQRGAMVRMMEKTGVQSPGYAEIVRAKLDIIGAVGSVVTGALIDAEFGAAPAIAAGALPGRTGLVIALEETGYQEREGDRLARRLPGWTVGKIKRMGASAVKLLVYYNPHREAAARAQEALIEEVARECRRWDLPLMVEGVVYASPGSNQAAFTAERASLVIETARRLTQFDIDLYKVEFPVLPEASEERRVWGQACERLHAACRTPWALLSAGVDFDAYAEQLRIACASGASGFVAGRAIWKEAISLRPGAERERFLRSEMPRRVETLVAIAAAGRPWHESPSHRYDPTAITGPAWYEAYPEA